ncbi:unnamed protein product [Urochloa decumbens]|uniref:Uncharacterized protein n=1 Tax=Urochloa decumbens TaxID=240449 RepID=A0ABC8VX50_9POAL
MPVSSSRLPLGVLLLILSVVALLLSLSCPVAAAAATGNNNYSGSGGGRVLAAAGAPPRSIKWQRRLEEETAPEFGSSLAGAGQQYINYDTLNKDRPACGSSCAAQGASYTRPCIYAQQCRP